MKHSWLLRLLPVALLVLSFTALPAHAQALINQEEMAEILNRPGQQLESLPEVYYDYYVFPEETRNRVIARHHFYETIGDGDIETGRKRSRVVELLNRKLMRNVRPGDTLVVPTAFDLEMRAYSPFPRYYPGARSFDKLFIMDKSIQAFAAYEHGRLVRWGIINTGSEETPTPNGRFNFNWQTEFRVSSLSPPGERWEMYWVFNIHHQRGIHVHQYEMPTGGPTSHGCVRLIDADAKWVYDWADTWDTTLGDIGPGTAEGRLLDQGTTVLVLGEEPAGTPRPFQFKERYPVLKKVDLPDHPYDVEPGTPQQRQFDRLRASNTVQ